MDVIITNAEEIVTVTRYFVEEIIRLYLYRNLKSKRELKVNKLVVYILCYIFILDILFYFRFNLFLLNICMFNLF